MSKALAIASRSSRDDAQFLQGRSTCSSQENAGCSRVRNELFESLFFLQEQDFLPPATRIRNEIEEGEGFSGDDDDDEDDEEERKRSGRGAEVAPPCDMGYYGASQVFLGLFFSFCWKLLLLHEYIPRVEDEAEVDSAAMRTWLMPSLLG